MSIILRVDSTRVQDTLGRYVVFIPKAGREGIFEAALMLETELKEEVNRQNLVWSGNLFSSIKAKSERNGDKQVINIPAYGHMLAKMRTHRVSTSNPRIRDWVQYKMGFIPKVITVHRHDFIAPAIERVNPRRVVGIVERKIQRELRR